METRSRDFLYPNQYKDNQLMLAPFRSYEEDTEEAMRQCLVLLEETDLDTGVRSGDIYGFMIEHYASTSDFQKVSFHFHFHFENFGVSAPNVSLTFKREHLAVKKLIQGISFYADIFLFHFNWISVCYFVYSNLILSRKERDCKDVSSLAGVPLGTRAEAATT